jgi:biotin synthase-like enzyme
MKILFIQLPLIDHNMDYIQGNIPCAPEAMAGYLLARFPSLEVETLPFHIASFGSDMTLLRAVDESGADIISFTCYSWNIERNLELASRLKKNGCRSQIIFGGPEIAEGSIALLSEIDAVDFFVSGEGEWFFNELLSGNIKMGDGGGVLITQPVSQLIAPVDIFEPFTAGRLDPMSDGSVFMELARGCPCRCSYCFYSKNSPGVRELPFSLVTDALKMKERTGLTEIYLLAPTFNHTPLFRERLEEIRGANTGVALHTEIRAGGITSETARLMADAGFRSLEIGLQTLNREALRRASRGSDPEAEIKGILNLKNAGIDLKIGIIPGLPGDDPETFIEGIHRLADLGIAENLELYYLMALPGTRLREELQAEAPGSFQAKPPYYFTGDDRFTAGDIAECAATLEQVSGYSRVRFQMPDMAVNTDGVLTGGVAFSGDSPEAWDCGRYIPLIETVPFTFRITLTRPEALIEGIPRLLGGISRTSALYNVIIYCDRPVNENFLIDYMEGSEPDTCGGRFNFFGEWREGLSVRFYQVYDSAEMYEKAFISNGFVEPVLRLNSSNIGVADALAPDAMLLITAGGYPAARSLIVREYREAQELLGFESEDERGAFFSDIDVPFIKLPFRFRTLTV